MIQKVLTPEKTDFDLAVSLPAEYIGKEVHVIFFVDEELNQVIVASNKKPSDFFGSLTQEEGKKMQEYLLQSRKEWERDI